MTFICEKCNNIFESGEERKCYEADGREWNGCPVCSGDYHEAKICRRCSEWTPAENISWDGYCEKCGDELREKIRFNPVELVQLSEQSEEKRACYLNIALLWFFSEEQIERILTETLREAAEVGIVDCRDFLDECDARVLHDWEEQNGAF